MTRSVIVIAIAIVIVIAGLIIYIERWGTGPSTTSTGPSTTPPVGPRPPESRGETPKINNPPHPETVLVSINAIPWARVFIKLPGNDYFIAPRPEHFTIRPELNDPKSNVTPIRGALVVPEETAIKLVYQEKEKVFPYKEWKGRRTISHDFSGE